MFGAVAQLGERLNGIQEAVSSILSSSTRNFLRLMRCMGLFLLAGRSTFFHADFRTQGRSVSVAGPGMICAFCSIGMLVLGNTVRTAILLILAFFC